MEDPSPSDPTAMLVPSELRRRVESTCAEARIQRAGSAMADAALRDARRAAAGAHDELEVALETLDQRRLVDHKDEARRSYRHALSMAADAQERQRAATTWLRRIDELNRASRGALGQVLMLRARCESLDQAVRDASMASSVQRIRTETAEAACVEARQRLAEQDRWASDRVTPVVVPVGRAGAGFQQWATAVELDGDALAIEWVLAGDARVTRHLARQMSDLTGHQPSRCLLLLQVLAEAIVASAIDHGYLRFDRSHPLWAHLSLEEAHAVSTALRDLGFRYDLVDGWYGDRAPQGRDLALALAYAGVDAQAMRLQIPNEELRRLPASVRVAPLEHLAQRAPDLELDHVHGLVGHHALELADLWDHWADVRALLLGPTPVAVEA